MKTQCTQYTRQLDICSINGNVVYMISCQTPQDIDLTPLSA